MRVAGARADTLGR